MKAPVGLSSDRTVLRQQDGGASPHTGSQSQSNNSNSNILEFHIYNLLVSQKISPQRALCTGPVCKAIF